VLRNPVPPALFKHPFKHLFKLRRAQAGTVRQPEIERTVPVSIHEHPRSPYEFAALTN